MPETPTVKVEDEHEEAAPLVRNDAMPLILRLTRRAKLEKSAAAPLPPDLTARLVEFKHSGSSAAAAGVCDGLVKALGESSLQELTPKSLTIPDQRYDGDEDESSEGCAVDQDDDEDGRRRTSGYEAQLKATPASHPTAIWCQPNKLVAVRIVTASDAGNPLTGQFEAYARQDLPPGTLVPFAGKVVKNGRVGYEFALTGTEFVLDPDPRCAAAYVNDFAGPDRKNKAQKKSTMNVRFEEIHDGSKFPHVFWRVMGCTVPAGATLWGDYGDSYWRRRKKEADVPLSAVMHRILYCLGGCSQRHAIDIDAAGSTPDPTTAHLGTSHRDSSTPDPTTAHLGTTAATHDTSHRQGTSHRDSVAASPTANKTKKAVSNHSGKRKQTHLSNQGSTTEKIVAEVDLEVVDSDGSWHDVYISRTRKGAGSELELYGVPTQKKRGDDGGAWVPRSSVRRRSLLCPSVNRLRPGQKVVSFYENEKGEANWFPATVIAVQSKRATVRWTLNGEVVSKAVDASSICTRPPCLAPTVLKEEEVCVGLCKDLVWPRYGTFRTVVAGRVASPQEQQLSFVILTGPRPSVDHAWILPRPLSMDEIEGSVDPSFSERVLTWGVEEVSRRKRARIHPRVVGQN